MRTRVKNRNKMWFAKVNRRIVIVLNDNNNVVVRRKTLVVIVGGLGVVSVWRIYYIKIFIAVCW